MAGETVVTIVGNLTADPELRYTQNGIAVANFTIASTPREWDRQRNEFVDGEALFMRSVVWREFAEHVSQSLTKGTRVIAQGRLEQTHFEDRDGNKRSGWQLQIDTIGPDLRYATAVVTRNTGGSRTQERHREQQRADDYRPEEPWGTAGSYNDETPF